MSHDQTISTYNQFGKVYDREVIEFWEQFPTEFIDTFVAHLPGKHVLDIGSGSGRDAVLLRDRGLDVVCVDASSTMVAMTQKLGFESHEATFDGMSFAENSFDGLWAYTSLLHVPKEDAARTVARAKAWLKPGGYFAVGFIEGDTAGMVERSSMPGYTRYFKKYTSDEIKQLMGEAGFEFVFENLYQPQNSTYINQIYKKG